MKFVGPLYISQTFKISPLISIYWHRYHRQFVDASRERYFRNINFLSEIHSNIADYFLGIWGGRPKPFEYSELQRQRFFLDDVKGEEDRKVITWSLIETFLHNPSLHFISVRRMKCWKRNNSVAYFWEIYQKDCQNIFHWNQGKMQSIKSHSCT